jgi:hypothetical protein
MSLADELHKELDESLLATVTEDPALFRIYNAYQVIFDVYMSKVSPPLFVFCVASGL